MSRTISTEEYRSRLAVWCGRGKEYDALPRKRKDRWILFHALMQSLQGNGPWAEGEIDAAIRAWLAGPGRGLHVDPVWIRRELIDGGFLARDRAGRAYQRADRYRLQFDFVPEVEGLDVDALLAEERRRSTARSGPPAS